MSCIYSIIGVEFEFARLEIIPSDNVMTGRVPLPCNYYSLLFSRFYFYDFCME